MLGDVDVRLADDAMAVFERHAEMNVVERDRDDLAMDVEHFREFFDAVLETAHDVRKRGEQEVADGVPGNAAAFLEAVFKQAADDLGVFRQRDDGTAHVAGWKNAEFVTQFAGRTARICHRDDGGKIECPVFAQAGEDVEGPGSAAYGRDVAFHLEWPSFLDRALIPETCPRRRPTAFNPAPPARAERHRASPAHSPPSRDRHAAAGRKPSPRRRNRRHRR